jgi:membrane-bound ClpP family serine protease
VREAILQFISDANVSFGLTMLGGIGIVWEFAAPGWVAPGVVGLAMLTLGVAGLGPAWLGVPGLLLLAGLAILAAEVKYRLRGAGIVSGVIAIVASAWLAGVDVSLAAPMAAIFALVSKRVGEISIRARANKAV